MYILDGGLEKWKAEGKELSQEFPQVETGNFKGEVQKDYFINYEEFKATKDRDDVVLLDARPPAVYEGKGPWQEGRTHPWRGEPAVGEPDDQG